MRRPVNSPYTITTEFGVKDSYAKFGYHSGVDYAVPLNRPIYAPTTGTLTNVVSPTGGNMVVIYDGQFWHRLMHNNSFSRGNGSVNEGDVVALAGTTGLSTGVHCHWDINAEGTYPSSFAAFRDPAKWLAGEYKIVTPSLGLNQRLLANPTGVNQRTEPNTSAQIIKEWPYDQEPFTFKGYVVGENINGNSVWFVGAISGGYFWSGAFQGGADTKGLENLTPAIPTPPTPVPPTIPDYVDFTAELPVVTSVVPAHRTNYELNNFPAQPIGVVIHDFGTDGKDTLAGSLAWFRQPDTTAPHFTVSGAQIIQNGKLDWRMYHAGAKGNIYFGVEVDPDVDTNPTTRNSVETLIGALEAKLGYKLQRFTHDEFMATSCGDDIKKAGLLTPPTPPVSDLEARVKIIEDKLLKIKEIL